jgi:hypothetical protein
MEMFAPISHRTAPSPNSFNEFKSVLNAVVPDREKKLVELVLTRIKPDFRNAADCRDSLRGKDISSVTDTNIKGAQLETESRALEGLSSKENRMSSFC